MFFFFISVAPEIRAVPSEGVLIVKEGEPASLACEIIKGNPTPEITWKRKVGKLKWCLIQSTTIVTVTTTTTAVNNSRRNVKIFNL